MVFLSMMMTLLFTDGTGATVVVERYEAPSMEACIEFVENQPKDEAVQVFDGTIIITYLECGKES